MYIIVIMNVNKRNAFKRYFFLYFDEMWIRGDMFANIIRSKKKKKKKKEEEEELWIIIDLLLFIMGE